MNNNKMHKRWPGLGTIPRPIWIWAIIVILLEIFVFNYKTFISTSSASKKTLAPSEAVLDGLEYSGTGDWYTVTSNNPVIEYENVDQRVKMVYFDMETAQITAKTDISMWYTDTTRDSYSVADSGVAGTNKTFYLLYKDEASKYLQCNYFGNAGSLKFELNLSEGDVISFRGITLNRMPALHISLLRISLLFLSFTGLYLLSHAKIMQLEYERNNVRQSYILWGIIAAFSIFLVLVFALYTDGINISDLTSETGNQVSKELVDAFENGSVALNGTPSQELLELDNPYDITQRVAAKVQYRWDHVLYQGKYYSYYGIAPVLLVFLPYHMLTGYYFPTTVLCLLGAVAGSVFLALAYLEIFKRWIRNMHFGMLLTGLIIMLFSSGAVFCVVRPSFYENAETFGFLFYTLSLLLFLRSGIFSSDRINWKPIAFSTLCMGIAVLSRPTFALYAAAEVLMLGMGYVDTRKQMEKRERVTYLLASLFPLAVLAVIQMGYNALRFGSVFDFGIQYSLTINDFTNTEFTFRLGFLSVWSFLFSIPRFNSTFPYMHSVKDVFGLNGAYYSDTGIMTGLFIRVLPMSVLFGLPWTIRKKCSTGRWNVRQLIRKTIIFGIPCILVPLIILIATWESGHALRYNVDFASQMLFLVCFLIYGMYDREKSMRALCLIEKVMIVCMIWCVVATTLTFLQYIPDITRTVGHSNEYNTRFYYKLAQLFSFWN